MNRSAFRRRALLLSATALSGLSLLLSGAASAAQFSVVVAPVSDPLLANLQIPADAPQVGMWGPVQPWPLVPIHAALMPNGKIVTYGTPQGLGVQDGRTYDVWDPSQGFGAGHAVLPGLTTVNAFCSAQALRTDGTLMTSGGIFNNNQDKGSAVINAAATGVSALNANMADDRYYASMITQADGSQIILGGDYPYAEGWTDPAASINNGWNTGMTPEVYKPASGWTSLLGATSRDAFGPDNSRYWYPRAWVAPNGKIFGISSDTVWFLDSSGSGNLTFSRFKTGPRNVSSASAPNTGPGSTAAMYDRGKILQVGGNSLTNFDGLYPASSAATVFDITGAKLAYADTAPMNFPRDWATATVLPTGKVVVTGGSSQGDAANTGDVRSEETWDPATARWTLGPSQADYRGYHSNAMLLQDGAVMVAGGGVPGPVVNFSAQVYYPPYLFTAAGGQARLAARPQIVSLSGNALGHNQSFKVEVSTSGPISQLVLVGLSEVTHSFNSGQRRYPLAFTQSGTVLATKAPASGSEAPPGYYQLVAVDASGVPSPGAIVALGAGVAPPSTSATPVQGGNTATAIPAIASSVAAPVLGNWAAVGVQSQRVATGADGTTVVISNDNTVWEYVSDNNWKLLPSKMASIAVRNANSIWGVGLDGTVYRFDGSAWTSAGSNASTVSVSADGVVAVTNPSNQVWYKTTDDARPLWQRLPNVQAKRVAVMSAHSFWTIGLDSNVYRSDMTGAGAQVGTAAAEIAASADGTVLVTNANDRTIWQKSTDDTGNAWSPARLQALSVAAPGSGRTVAVGLDNNVYRW